MFDTVGIGKKIASLRKSINMTQMELADAMEVSYQAVSNWERGNSMPDISKLPELAKVFQTTIDDLLSNQEELNIVKKIQVEEPKDLTLEELSNIAPALKPSDTNRILETVLKENSDLISLKDLVAIAPFLEEEYLDELVSKVDYIENADGIVALAPFLSEDTLSNLVLKLDQESNSMSIHLLTALAPFIEEEVLSHLVQRHLNEGTLEEYVSLFPFLKEETLKNIAEIALKKQNMKLFKMIAPFL